MGVEVMNVDRTLSSNSTFLFAMPSFTRGMARALDMGSTLNVYNEAASAEAADAAALANDWGQVGIDIAGAMESFGNEK